LYREESGPDCLDGGRSGPGSPDRIRTSFPDQLPALRRFMARAGSAK
jgi:hypothetical protein